MRGLGKVGDGNFNKTLNFTTDINVKRNHLTTIKGNLLTEANEVEVEVVENGAFANENIYIEGDFTLTQDMVIDRPLVVRAGAKAVINLNGKSIKVNHDSGETGESEGIIVYGNLTIEGEGTVEANTRAVWARGNTGAKITINGGNYVGSKQNTEVIYASGNGQIEINGGTFEALTPSSGHGSEGNRPIIILNLHGNGASGCSIVVKGGSFKNFDPADNIAENPKQSFVAEDYASVQNGEWFEVFYTGGVNIDALVKNVDELNTALADSNVTNILLYEGAYGTIVAKSNKTIIGTEGAKVDCVNLCGADNITLKNIAFDAATAKLGYDKVSAKQYANIITGDNTNKQNKGSHNVVIDGCTFTGTFANGGAAIALTDYKRTSGFSGNITIKNCTFEQVGAYYNIYGHYTGDSLNGHGKFVIENNTFNTVFTQGRAIYLGRYASNVPVEVKDNTFNVATSLTEAMYVQDHSNYGVSINASNNTFAN